MAESTASRVHGSLASRVNVLLTGLYAWTLTVAAPALLPGSPPVARAAAGVAPLVLVAGVVLFRWQPGLGRAFGIAGFVGLSLVAWVLLGPAVGVRRLEPIKAALGGIGWALFALGWGALRPLGQLPEDRSAAGGGPLTARAALPRGASAVLGVAVAGALLSLALAWVPRRPHHALLAQAVALLIAIALTHTGAMVAVDRGQFAATARSSARTRVLGPFWVLACWLLMGAIWAALR
jgi:hypothetical protein